MRGQRSISTTLKVRAKTTGKGRSRNAGHLCMAALAPLAFFATLCADVRRQRRFHGLAAYGHAEQVHVSGAGLPHEQQQNLRRNVGGHPPDRTCIIIHCEVGCDTTPGRVLRALFWLVRSAHRAADGSGRCRLPARGQPQTAHCDGLCP